MAKVIVYSTSSCPWCSVAKDFLKKNKVAFEDVNVGTDRERAREMIDKSGQMGVPVLDIDGEIIIGFNEPAIRKALQLKT
ncbi:MAG: glutaredoxin domain-containing protein [Candidatus Woesearchaeota archaeon]